MGIYWIGSSLLLISCGSSPSFWGVHPKMTSFETGFYFNKFYMNILHLKDFTNQGHPVINDELLIFYFVRYEIKVKSRVHEFVPIIKAICKFRKLTNF